MDQGYSQNCRLAIISVSAFDEEMESCAQLWISSQHRLGESIIWHAARQCYYWVDLLDPALYAHDPAKGITSKQLLALTPPIGSIAATTDPSLLMLAHRDGLSLLDVRNMVMTPFCNPEAGRDAIIYNDIKVDRWGRLWVGTSHAKEQEARGALWCVESSTRWALADAGFAISNGPAFSLDGRTMYFNDSLGRTTYAYDIAPDHLAARNRRSLIEHPEADGLPDGIVVDATGDIWTAQWAGSALLRFDSTGKLKTRHPVHSVHVTTLCFGGNDLDQLKITTATDGAAADALQRFPLSGSLFHLDCQTVGVAEPLFIIQ
jgi:xylono-1,5-lactonase